MQILRTIHETQQTLLQHKRRGQTIGFVPTMGYLHSGHISLVREAKKENDIVVVSIFVNPTQFAPHEDLSKYPRDFERDHSLLEAEGVAYIFYPSAEEIYPQGSQTEVTVKEKTRHFEGEFRPTHFAGVTTIVTILLQCTLPDIMYLGQKDAQQAAVLTQMVSDLHIPCRVTVCPTIREEDGLAKSSRNVYLTEKERSQSVIIYKALSAVYSELEQNGNVAVALEKGKLVLSEIEGISIDYLAVADDMRFAPAEQIEKEMKYYIITAVRINGKRLIDNLVFIA